MPEPIASYHHRGGNMPLLGATIGAHCAAIATRFAEHEAVVSLPQQRRLSYCQLQQEIDRLARGLIALGFARGDRIGIWSTNNVEWLLLQMATARIGAILVNINPACQKRELLHALRQSEVQGLFVIPRFRHSDYVAMLFKVIPELREGTHMVVSRALPALRRIVLYESADAANTVAPTAGFTPWRRVVEAAAQFPPDELERRGAGKMHRRAWCAHDVYRGTRDR